VAWRIMEEILLQWNLENGSAGSLYLIFGSMCYMYEVKASRLKR